MDRQVGLSPDFLQCAGGRGIGAVCFVRGGGRHQFDDNRPAINSRTYLVELNRKRDVRYEHPDRKQGMNLNIFSSSPRSCNYDKVAADAAKPAVFFSLGPMDDPELSDIPLIDDGVGA